MEKFYRGIPGFKSIAIGNAVVLVKSNIFIPRYKIEQSDVNIEKEIEKLEVALLITRNQLEKLKYDIKKNHSSLETGYLDATMLFLEDPLMKKKITTKIKDSYINIEWIFNEVIEELANKLEESNDGYFQDRAPDIVSIGHKVLKNLMKYKDIEMPDIAEDSIIVAHTLSPHEIISLYKKNIKAFITELGGKTSHASIMARDLKIPAVLGLKDITKKILTGDRIIIDGLVGTVIVNPEEDIISFYKFKEKEQKVHEKSFEALENKACILKGGEEITLLSNIEVEEEIDLAIKSGGKGIGLFRTEYIFLNRNQEPNEDEQFEIYKNTVERFYPYEVTIRAIDIGGDKKPLYIDFHDENRTFLGTRGIRFALSHINIFKTQIKAILRAGIYGNVRIMFPMVNDIDEIKKIIQIVNECKNELEKISINYSKNIKMGVMVETPSSVLLLDKIADYVNFISVGTNDLIQYTLAIDRGNSMISDEFDPIHPAILRFLKTISDVASKKHLEVSICGEMSGNPLYTLLLIGLGYNKLSMSSMIIPTVKQIIINSSLSDAKKIASKSLELTSKKDIIQYIRNQMIKRFKDLEDFFRQNG